MKRRYKYFSSGVAADFRERFANRRGTLVRLISGRDHNVVGWLARCESACNDSMPAGSPKVISLYIYFNSAGFASLFIPKGATIHDTELIAIDSAMKDTGRCLKMGFPMGALDNILPPGESEPREYIAGVEGFFQRSYSDMREFFQRAEKKAFDYYGLNIKIAWGSNLDPACLMFKD